MTDVVFCLQCAALLATRAAAETLARSPPSSTPHASRAKLLNLLRDAYHDAAAVSAQHGDDRHARLEVTAGELLLDALVGRARRREGKQTVR